MPSACEGTAHQPGWAEVSHAQTQGRKASSPRKVTKTRALQVTWLCKLLLNELCCFCSLKSLSAQNVQWASCDRVQGKADFLGLNQRFGFMFLFSPCHPPDAQLLLIPNSTAPFFFLCMGHSLELYYCQFVKRLVEMCFVMSFSWMLIPEALTHEMIFKSNFRIIKEKERN